jgi:peroxiredoxin Q/BCP
LLQEGDAAPEWERLDQDGEPVRSSDFPGRSLVLYFYPKAATPGCTRQACGVRDHRADYERSGAVVLGVSGDRPEDLRRFAAEERLNFPLLSDPGNELARVFGVGQRGPGRSERSTFVIGPDGRIKKAFPKVDPDRHDELVLAALAPAA